MIVEIGAVLFDGRRPLKVYDTLVNPSKPIPLDASTVNGITDAMVHGKPTIGAVLDEFADFCGDLPLVAHNAPFDYKFLLEDVRTHRSKAPRGVVLDTLPLARMIFPGLPNYKLWTLVRHFDFPCGIFHRAEEDSVYCGLLFAKIIDTLEKRGESTDEDDLIRMIGKEAMRFPHYKIRRDQLDLF